MKAIIAAVSQQCSNAFSLCIQSGYIKPHSTSQQTLSRILLIQNARYSRILNIIINLMNEIRLSGHERICNIRLSFVSFDNRSDAGIKKPLVLQLLSQVVAGKHGTYAVVDDRRFANGLQSAVYPFRGITSRKGICCQWQFKKREPPAIGHLAYITAKRNSIQIAIVTLCFQLYAI